MKEARSEREALISRQRGIKPYKRPDIWVPREEPVEQRDRVNEMVLDVLTHVTPELVDMVDRGVGRKVISEYVPGRDEDMQIEIDGIAEERAVKYFDQAAQKYGFALSILSEHENYIVGNGKPPLYVAMDPFDNSEEYHRKFTSVAPFFVFSIYDQDRNPLAAGASNLQSSHLFINRDGRNYEYNPRTGDLTPIDPPKEIRGIHDPGFAVVSYEGKSKYSEPFRKHFGLFLSDRIDRSAFHTVAGSHTYLDLATGAASLYIMEGEPRGEIDPGAPFALSAGCTLQDIDPETGNPQPYRFDPDRQRESVPLYMASRTVNLLYQALGYYMESKARERQIFPGYNEAS